MRDQNFGGDDTAVAFGLDQLGNRTFPINQEIGEYKLSIPLYLIDSTMIQNLSEVVFRVIAEKYKEGLWISCKAINTPTNKAAEEVNTVVVMSKLLENDSQTCRSGDILHKTRLNSCWN